MLLSDRTIRTEIAPRMVDPDGVATFSEGVSGKGLISWGLSSAGYDFRLGRKVLAFHDLYSPIIDPVDINATAFSPLPISHARRSFLTRNDPPIEREYEYVTIPPRGYILGETIEYLDVPSDVLVIVVGKSTYARSGIIVNCTPLEPGWRGRVTLEIGNLSSCPARVYVGMGIAQALFHRIDREPERVYGTRSMRYQDQPGLVLPTVQ